MNIPQIAEFFRHKAPQVYDRYIPYDFAKDDNDMNWTIRVWVDGGNFFVIKIHLLFDGDPIYLSSYVTGFNIEEHPMIQFKSPVPSEYDDNKKYICHCAELTLKTRFKDWDLISYRVDITEPTNEQGHYIIKVDTGNLKFVYVKIHENICIGFSYNDYKFAQTVYTRDMLA